MLASERCLHLDAYLLILQLDCFELVGVCGCKGATRRAITYIVSSNINF